MTWVLGNSLRLRPMIEDDHECYRSADRAENHAGSEALLSLVVLPDRLLLYARPGSIMSNDRKSASAEPYPAPSTSGLLMWPRG
jgi:hypothetical protein